MEYQDKAFVLHSRRYRENSRIVELFTENHGRQSVVVRVPKKRAATKLNQYQPFHELFVTWSGRSDLKNLRSSEFLDYWSYSGRQSICGLYLNELLLYLLEKALAMPELYEAYRTALDGLKDQEAVHIPLRAFEKHLLDDLGYFPSLWDDAVSGDLLDADVERPLFFSPSHGFSHTRLPDAFAISWESLRALEENDWQRQSSAKEIKMIFGSSINRLLNGKTLRSRELIQSLTQKKS